MKTINVIVGPTSSGKTSLALNLCKEFGGIIVSADSRQIYKHMDIGTGKVPINSPIKTKKNDAVWEFDGIKVYGYDLTTPDKPYTAADYLNYVNVTVRELSSTRPDLQIYLVGGTGFYIDAATGRMRLDQIKPDLKLRKSLQNQNLLELQKKATSLNINDLNESDFKNKVRLIRLIELKSAKNNGNSPTPLPYLDDFEFRFLGLTNSREFLYKKVDLWAETIWKNGVVEETQKLLDLGFSDSKPLNGLIYKTVKEFIVGDKSEAEALQRIKFDLHSYIRRQQTWFKRNKKIKWFDCSNIDLKDVQKYLKL